MAEQNNTSNRASEVASLDEFLLLATAPPEITLLERYARSMELGRPEILSEQERKWVETNLAVNPVWQAAWTSVKRQTSRSRGLTRRLLFAASIVGFLSLGWLETLHESGLSGEVVVESVYRGRGWVAGADDQTEPPNSEVDIIEDAWVMGEFHAAAGSEEIIRDLERQYSESQQPYERAATAYLVGRYHEIAGRYATALDWYRVSLDASETSHYAGAASDGVRRMRRRTR